MFMHKSLERGSVGAAVSNQCFFQADYQIKHEIRALRWTAYVVNTSFHSVHTLYYINLYPSNQAQSSWGWISKHISSNCKTLHLSLPSCFQQKNNELAVSTWQFCARAAIYFVNKHPINLKLHFYLMRHLFLNLPWLNMYNEVHSRKLSFSGLLM